MAVYNGYKGANTCTKGPADGAKGAMAWFLAKYKELGGRNSGIYNCRNVRGSSRTTSLHGEGRAIDFGLKWYDKISVFEEFAEQLRLNSAELGIQCIIFNRKIFSGGYANKGWHRYGGVNPHTDHLHVELSWGAANRDLEDTIALWERELGGAGNVKPVGSKPKPKPVSNTKEPSAAVKKKLKNMGYPKQGIAEVKAYQDWHGLVPDGDWGDRTETKYQEVVRAQNATKKMKNVPDNWKSDGYWGATSKKWAGYASDRNGWGNPKGYLVPSYINNLKKAKAW